MKEINVQLVSELEAEGKEGMCEIRFDCLVRMYDSGTKKPRHLYRGTTWK